MVEDEELVVFVGNGGSDGRWGDKVGKVVENVEGGRRDLVGGYGWDEV